NVVPDAGCQPQLERPRPTADRRLRLEDLNLETRPGHDHGRGKAVRSRAHDHDVSHGQSPYAPRTENGPAPEIRSRAVLVVLVVRSASDDPNLLGLWALWTLADLELNPLTVFEAAVAL